MLNHFATQRVLVAAPAKLNLSLAVLARRTDGYHDIETLMARISLHDTLLLEADSPDISLSVDVTAGNIGGDCVPTDERNLVIRAAILLRESAGIHAGVRMKLTKRIPTQAGLGGGSSDAAAALLGLNTLWQLNYSTAKLAELAAKLGSDVPFFLADSPAAICRGRGEQLTTVPGFVGVPCVLAKPASGLSTADVYRHCVPQPPPTSPEELASDLLKGNLGRAASRCFNALQPAAEALNPEVADLRRRFDHLGLFGHQLTGSGTAYFGLCATWRQAEVAAQRLRAAGVPWVSVVSTGI